VLLLCLLLETHHCHLLQPSSRATTESIDLSSGLNEETSHLTDESPGDVVEVPPANQSNKHPLLQKGVTIANYDATKGIFTIGQQQWTIHKANKTASIQYISQQRLRMVCTHLKVKNQFGKGWKDKARLFVGACQSHRILY
jgi:hypothetical protein